MTDQNKERPNLLIVSGFLGSGKTSIIVALATRLSDKGHRIAIIVNEIGEIGVDDAFMRKLDLNVWELLGGCICCTLSGTLASTLENVEASYRPDLVIVETSGAADPRSVLDALAYYKGSLNNVRTVCIIDPLRFVPLMEVLTPLITAQIEKANIVVINKTDAASKEEIDFARLRIADINPHVLVVESGKKGDDAGLHAVMAGKWTE